MTQDDVIDLIGDVINILATIAAFALICVILGFAVTKLDKSPAKKTVPDCGSCRVYKDGVKK